MLDKATAKILEENVLIRVTEAYSCNDDVKLVKAITQITIMVLQEYEKLSPTNQ